MSPLELILVFIADGCPHCAALLDDFRARGVRFTEINLSRNPEELQRLRSFSWEHRLPVVVDHERVSIGFGGHASAFEALGVE